MSYLFIMLFLSWLIFPQSAQVIIFDLLRQNYCHYLGGAGWGGGGETSSYIIAYRPGIISCMKDKSISLCHSTSRAAMHDSRPMQFPCPSSKGGLLSCRKEDPEVQSIPVKSHTQLQHQLHLGASSALNRSLRCARQSLGQKTTLCCDHVVKSLQMFSHSSHSLKCQEQQGNHNVYIVINPNSHPSQNHRMS